MNNKLKMLVMSLVMQGIIKKYAKANVFFRLRILFIRFRGILFCLQILSQSAIKLNSAPLAKSFPCCSLKARKRM